MATTALSLGAPPPPHRGSCQAAGLRGAAALSFCMRASVGYVEAFAWCCTLIPVVCGLVWGIEGEEQGNLLDGVRLDTMPHPEPLFCPAHQGRVQVAPNRSCSWCPEQGELCCTHACLCHDHAGVQFQSQRRRSGGRSSRKHEEVTPARCCQMAFGLIAPDAIRKFLTILHILANNQLGAVGSSYTLAQTHHAAQLGCWQDPTLCLVSLP